MPKFPFIVSRSVVGIVLAYAVMAGLWVIISDRLFSLLADDIVLLSRWQSYSWGGIAITGATLFYLIGRSEVNALKRAEAERELLLRHFENMMRYANDMIVLLDSRNAIVEANLRAADESGYPLAELIGMQGGRLIAPRAMAEFESKLQEPGESGGKMFEIALQRSNGSTFLAEASMRLLDIDGKPYRLFIMRNVSEQLRMREQLQQLAQQATQQSHLLNSMLEACPLRTLLYDYAGRIVQANEHALESFGIALDDVRGKTRAELGRPEQEVAAIEQLRLKVMESGKTQQQEVRTIAGAIEFLLTPIKDVYGAVEFILCSERDVTERFEQEKRILQLSQMYRTLSRSNQAIVHDQDRDTLFRDICRIAIEAGNFRLAWIGLVEKDTSAIRLVMQMGDSEEFLQSVTPTTDASLPAGRMVPGQAVREGCVRVCNDFVSDPNSQPWRDLIQQLGYQSAAAFPLRQDGAVVGVLALYAGEASYFTPPLIELLEEMAGDLSFALDSLAHEAERRSMERALRESEERWSFALEGVGDGVWDWNTQSNHMVYSPGYWSLLGFMPGEADASVEDFDARIHPEDRATVLDNTVKLLRGEVPAFHQEYRLRCKDGSYKWVLSRGRVMSRNAEGNALRVIGTVSDITARREAEKALRFANEVFENSGEAIVVTDGDNHILSVNRTFTEVTGYSADEVMGRNPSVLASGKQDRDFYQAMWGELNQQGRWQGEIWNQRKNGEVYPEWLSIRAVRDEDGKVSRYIGIFTDIGERKKAEERIHQLANYDVLTGLPNLSLLQNHLEQAISSAHRHHRQLALLALDIDRFKEINATLGHVAGDLLLQQVAQGLLNCVRRGQDTVARQRGGEFLVLLPDLGVDAAAKLAQAIIDGLSHSYKLDGGEAEMTTTIGISLFPEDGTDSATLIANAEAAMFHAKEDGRNRYKFYTHEMNAGTLQRLTLENSLRQAMEREEFLVYYQPQVDLKSGKVVGAEALLRWKHPEMDMVSPSTFIELAEESGIIVPLGEWMINMVCRQIRSWQQEGIRTVPVSVNLSSRQFRQHELPPRIETILQEHGVEPFFLEIELTENTAMQDIDESIRLIQRIKRCGIRVSIDDFGTGQTSLPNIKHLNVDKLKIDLSLVQDLVDDAEDSTIVRAIVSMAHSLRLEVVAEGVETQKQFDFLKVLNCDQMQGYLFSEALPAEEFAAVLREDRSLPL